MPGHPLTLLVEVIVVCAVLGALFGLLKALRGPIGMLAYGGLLVTFYAYYRMGDRYFAQGVWEISVGCLVIMGFTLRHVPFLRTALAVALLEFGSRITKTGYPKPTVLAFGIIAAMIAIATFWTPKSQAVAPPVPPRPAAPVYRRGPQAFDPYTGRRLRKERNARPAPSTVWRWVRGR